MKTLFLFVFLLGDLSYAEIKTMDYISSVEDCKCKIKYSSKKYTEQQIRDNYALISPRNPFHEREMLTFKTDFANFDEKYIKGEVKAINAFTEKSKKAIQKVKALSPTFERIKTVLIQQLEVQKKFYINALNYTSTGDTKHLIKDFTSKDIPKKCLDIKQKLDDGGLDSTYTYIVKKSCENNVDPKACIARTKKRSSMAKRAYITGFGWRNCMNRHMRTVPVHIEVSKGVKEIDKLFISTTCECDPT